MLNSKIARKVAEDAYPVFVRNGWKYWTGTPTQEDLADTVEELLVESEKIEIGETISSGRFAVHIENTEFDIRRRVISLQLYDNDPYE